MSARAMTIRPWYVDSAIYFLKTSSLYLIGRSAVVRPQESITVNDDETAQIHVTNASLGDTLLHSTGRTSLKISYRDPKGPQNKEFVVCNFIPEKVRIPFYRDPSSPDAFLG